jgi:hypothetical protein
MNIAIRTRKDLGRCFTFPNVPQGSSTSILGCFPDQQLDGAESVGRVSYRSMKIKLHCSDLVWNPDDPDGAKDRLFFHYPSCTPKEGVYVVRREYSGPGRENLGNPPTW